MELHGTVRLHMPEHTLDIQRNLAVPGGFLKKFSIKVAIDKTGKMIDICLYFRQFFKPKRITYAKRCTRSSFFICCKILIFYSTGMRRLSLVKICPDSPETSGNRKIL